MREMFHKATDATVGVSGRTAGVEQGVALSNLERFAVVIAGAIEPALIDPSPALVHENSGRGRFARIDCDDG